MELLISLMSITEDQGPRNLRVKLSQMVLLPTITSTTLLLRSMMNYTTVWTFQQSIMKLNFMSLNHTVKTMFTRVSNMVSRKTMFTRKKRNVKKKIFKASQNQQRKTQHNRKSVFLN